MSTASLLRAPRIALWGCAAAFLVAPVAQAQRAPPSVKARRATTPLSAVDACQILTAPVVGLVGAPSKVRPHEPMLKKPRPIPHCAYRWTPRDLAAQEEAYQKQKARFDDAQEKKLRILPPEPKIPLGEHQVTLDWYAAEAHSKAARAAMQTAVDAMARNQADRKLGVRIGANQPRETERSMAMSKSGAPPTMRPPGATAGSQTADVRFLKIPDVGDEALWWPASGTLMVRQGAQRFTLDVQVAHFASADDPAYRFERDANGLAARTLATKLAARVR